MKHLSTLTGALVVASLVVLCHPLQAAPGVVINELHYNPDVKTERVEFVELYNHSTNTVNLSGWSFSDGIQYVFPAGTVMGPRAYLVVAENTNALRAKFNVTGALGPYTGNLSKYGEKVTLRDAAGAEVDTVEYKLGYPWPTVGDPPGYSIELIHPDLDNNLGGSWRASVAGSGVAPTETVLIQSNSTWRYFKGTSEASTPTTAWRQLEFDDSAWLTGEGPIGYGEAFIRTLLSDMNGNYSGVFLRKTFVVPDPSAITSVLLEAQYDDGFKVWINGVNVLDQNMAAGEVPYNGLSIAGEEYATYRLFTPAGAAAALRAGTNVIAIQAHNVGLSTSSDFFFDLRLRAQSGPSGRGPTPGRLNAAYALNAPPQSRQVEHTPQQPRSGETVRITAKVTDPDGVAAVTLKYQVVLPGQYIELADPAYTNAVNWTTLAMRDDGSGGDLVAGDEVYTALIPSSVQAHRRLIRYRITVRDALGAAVRVPYADDPQPNFAYFVHDGIPAWRGAVQPGASGSNGVVFTVTSNEMARLPALYLIGRSNTIANATWFSRYAGDLYQWGGTLVYDGKVYDHIRYRARGGVWRYSMVKNMWKFDMNRGHDFEARDQWGRKIKTPWRKVNLGANIQQGDFWHRGEQGMFETMCSRLMQLAGVECFKTAFLTLRVVDEADEAAPTSQYEGDFWGVYLLVEQEDGRFLEEHGLPDSNFYKMEGGTGELNNLGPNGPTDKSDLNYILNNYGAASDAWWRTNWNLARFWSYQAIVQATHHYDISDGKNYFYYYNPATRLWEIVPWDFDLTWAHNMYRSDAAGGGGVDAIMSRTLNPIREAGTGAQSGTGVIRLSGQRPAFDLEFRNRVREIRDLLFNTNETFRLLEEQARLLRGVPGTNYTVLDADRAQWDYNPKMISSTYTPNLNKAQQGYFYAFQRESATNAALKGSFEATLEIMRHYVRIRSEYLDSLAADPAIPARPAITYVGASGFPINRLTFRASNYAGSSAFASMKWRVGEITDTNSPSYQPGEPWKYEIEAVYESPAIAPFASEFTVPAGALRVGSRYRARVQFTDVTGRTSAWSPPVEFTAAEPEGAADLLSALRITEIMYNPLPGGFEYVELHNMSSGATLDLSGVRFTQGIEFVFPPGTFLPPGGYLLLINTTNVAAFRAYYGLDAGVPIVGPYSGALDNAGEELVLRTGAGGTDIVRFTYNDGRGWPQAADGVGHSLVLLESAYATQGGSAGSYGGNWRASAYLRGSPGRPDPAPPAGPVLNEIAASTRYADPAHPEYDSNDWIELYNPTDAPIIFDGGWFLSDDSDNLVKWAVPVGTVIPARGFASFDEVTGFHNPTNSGFGLDAAGERVFLSRLQGNAQDRIVDAISYKGQEEGRTYGRYPDGSPWWQTLEPPTRDATNRLGGPRVVVSEIQYHPPDLAGGVDNGEDEFVELRNASGAAVALFNTNGAWRLDGDISFTFPAGITLGDGEFLVVVNFDPAANPEQLAVFRGRYGMTNPAVRIVGPYGNRLPNSSGRVAVELPLAPETPGGPVAWSVVDEAIYADQSPWPCGTDGTGASLQRQAWSGFGNDSLLWAGGPPTPGAANAVVPPGAPVLTVPPADRIVGTNMPATFTVVACGPQPFLYQWRFNETDLPGATNATYTIPSATLAHAGLYAVRVSNPSGSVLSPPARLIVQLPPVIVAPPTNRTVVQYEDAVFTVAATGTEPIFYQWRYNGSALSGATNTTLVLTNLDPAQSGSYSVQVWNAAASVNAAATLTVLPLPVITQQPTGTNVPAGSNFTLRVTATGTGLLRYQWQFGGADIPGGTNSQFTVTNCQLADAGTYRVVVSDTVGSRASTNVTVNVLVRPYILAHPASQVRAAGETAVLTVEAGGQAPLWYRWRRNNSTFLWPGAASLVLSNLVLTNAGGYDVVITNLSTALMGGQTLSARAGLVVIAPPASQTVAPGTNLTLRAVLAGPTSFTNRFAWVFQGTNILRLGTNQAGGAFTLFTNDLVLTNVSAGHAGTYSFLYSNAVVATNQGGLVTNLLMPVAAFHAQVRVAGDADADTDGDGMPDAWETLYGLNPSEAGDAEADQDRDGLSNLQEYLAGTDPTDAASTLALSLDGQPVVDGQARLSFFAVSNKTYTLQMKEDLAGGGWSNLANVGSAATSRTVWLTNAVPAGVSNRYYRVRTPASP